MKQTFHYEHHRLEAIKTRRRFASFNILLFVGAAVIIGAQYVASHAATTTYGTIDGVKIDTSGTGTYGGSTTGAYSAVNVNIVKVGTTGGRNTTTNPFYFTQLVADTAGVQYKVTIGATKAGNYVLKGYTYVDGDGVSWNPQTTNFHTGSVATLTLKANHKLHMRWIWQYVAPPATPVPTPKPTATPVKTPVPTPVKTPVKTVVKTPTPGQGSGPTPTPVPDTSAPAAPGGFEALATSDNALVKLSWEAATDNTSIASYHLERSTDQATWAVVADQSELAFTDATAAFGVHYFYRISAFDPAGNQSPFATADATTAQFTGSSSEADTTVASEDTLVTVAIPAGAFDTETDCTITTSETTVAAGGQTIVAGPYQLICKDSSGNQILTTKSALKWDYNIKAKMTGFRNPTVVMVDENDKQSKVQPITFNTKSGELSFASASLGATAVLAAVKPGFPWSAVVFGLLFIAAVVGIVVFILRRKQKQSYDEYIRSKYYDL